MKTQRKLRTRRLALDFSRPANPLPEDRVRAGFARLKEEVAEICRARQNLTNICVDIHREIPNMHP